MRRHGIVIEFTAPKNTRIDRIKVRFSPTGNIKTFFFRKFVSSSYSTEKGPLGSLKFFPAEIPVFMQPKGVAFDRMSLSRKVAFNSKHQKTQLLKKTCRNWVTRERFF